MTETTNVPLTTSQIRFLMDVLMGASLGITKLHAIQNNVNDSEVYNQLARCLPNPPDPTEDW